MQQVKQLWFPFLIIAIPGIIFSLLLPYFPVDETRYLSVAWEMKLHNSFIVPLQNALPYAHKPPFLFWLLNLNWLLLGVNEVSLRCIPLLFSMFNITLLYKIGRLLWEEEKIARYAAIILSSTLSYLLWSALIMFDIVLTFWVLLAVFSLLSASKKHSIKSWLLVGISIGGGLLTKGPVVCVYILPVGILAFLWIPKETFSRRWFVWLALSLSVGIAVILVWLIPAAMTGGESYREAILWGQTVNRLANAFAHKRPFWWYLPWLPVLLLPWVLLPPSWRGGLRWTNDLSSRFLIIWMTSTLLILSLISSKQVHYLIPLLPAFSLLMAKNIVSCNTSEKTGSRSYAVGAFYSALGIVALSLSFARLGVVEQFGASGTRALSFGLVAIGIVILSLKQSSLSRLVNHTALSSVAAFAIVASSGSSLFERYDLHRISGALKTKQEEGYTILHYGKYHGQYQFLGRLNQPMVTMESMEAISQYAKSHEKVALITYEPQTATMSRDDIYFQQPFRSKQVVLWNKSGIQNFIKLREGKTKVSLTPSPSDISRLQKVLAKNIHP